MANDERDNQEPASYIGYVGPPIEPLLVECEKVLYTHQRLTADIEQYIVETLDATSPLRTIDKRRG